MTDSFVSRPRDFVRELSGSRDAGLLALVCALAIAVAMLPLQWSGNELHYFDLSYRYVRPDAFTELHAAFESSDSRFLSFYILGYSIVWFGFEATKTLFAMLFWVLYAFAIAAMARGLRMRAMELFVGLVIFLAFGQSLLGGEWLFGTSEAKLFAYVAVMFGIACALAGRWTVAMVCAAVAVYFHFLVGGFWAAAIILLHAISTGRLWISARLLLTFSLLILPMFGLLLVERIEAVDVSGLDRPWNEIYAVFRNAHHVAPFAHGFGGFASEWLPGVVGHAMLGLVFVKYRHQQEQRLSHVFTWMAWLNFYVVAIMAVTFLDRHTHLVAAFYLFRPSALILLLSVFALIAAFAPRVEEKRYPLIAAAAVAVWIAVALPVVSVHLGMSSSNVAAANRLEAGLTDDQWKVVNWIRGETPAGAAIVALPADGTGAVGEDADLFGSAFERLIGRPTVANFKFLPTDKSDLVKWYLRLQARNALAQGDCTQLTRLSANYVLVNSAVTWSQIKPCVQKVYKNKSYTIGKVRPDL